MWFGHDGKLGKGGYHNDAEQFALPSFLGVLQRSKSGCDENCIHLESEEKRIHLESGLDYRFCSDRPIIAAGYIIVQPSDDLSMPCAIQFGEQQASSIDHEPA